MNAYVDSSIILRLLFSEPGRLPEWADISYGLTSRLTEVECRRTIHRLRLQGRLTDAQAVAGHQAVYQILRSFAVADVTPSVLARACDPMPSVVGTLDAIHLTTALIWREHSNEELVLATHDRALAGAARAYGFDVIGA